MANMAAKMFAAVLEEKQVNYSYLDEEQTVIRVGWKLDASKISIFFKFSDECTNVHFEGHEFLNVSADKIETMYKICNQCNREYRWTKFTVNEDNKEIVVEGDAVIQLDSCGMECFELMIRTTQIVEDAYPKFMKAMWA